MVGSLETVALKGLGKVLRTFTPRPRVDSAISQENGSKRVSAIRSSKRLSRLSGFVHY